MLLYFQRGQANPSVSFTPTLAAVAKGVSARCGVCPLALCFGPCLYFLDIQPSQRKIPEEMGAEEAQDSSFCSNL